MSFCIISREDPPIHFGKLRAQQKLYELRMSSLKFNLKDTETFFNSTIKAPLNQEQINYFYQRSEGWVAGLQLIAMTLQEVDVIDDFIKTFDGNQDYIMDYLLEEVLYRHSDMSREFLLKTSIFSYFSYELCAFVLELPYETVVLEMEYLLRTNSFLISLNKEKEWYRYHHLFRMLLKQQLRGYKDLNLSHLCKRAGIWYEDQEAYQEAIFYYLEGEQFEEAQRLIEKRFTVMDMELNSASWLDLAKRLPLEYLKSSPVLCLGYGWALLDQGNIHDCQKWFQKSKELYDTVHLTEKSDSIKIHDPDTFENIPIMLLCSKAYIAAINGKYESLLSYTEELTKLARNSRYSRQWIIESFVGMMHWGQGNLIDALKIMINLKEDASNGLSKSVRHTFTWIIAEIYIQKGELTRAKLLLENAIETILENNDLPFLVATYYMLLALIESIRGHRDKAYNFLETSKVYGYRFEFMDWRYKYHLLKSRLYMQDGLYEQAEACIQEGKQYRFLNPAPEVLTLEDLSFWLLMLTDADESKKFFLVDEAIKKLEETSLDLPAYNEEMHWKIILNQAPVEIYGQRLLPICEKLLERGKLQQRDLDIIDYTLILRRFIQDSSQKKNLLNSAKIYSRREGILQPFIEFAEENNMLEDINVMPFEARRAQINKNLPEPLTGRELEILLLIAKGYSNQEISNHLFITHSTVKSYNNRLFSKLEVKRRTEAVAKAKRIGLLK
jgi:LuxR family maltose regulon positive regulatory protein